MTELSEFPCNACGACCRNTRLAAETRYLDRGDGICHHLDNTSSRCQIYETRPDICRVERQFKAKYQKQMDWAEFVRLNLAACEQLKAGER